MCLAQGHNAVTPVRLEPAALRSRVKHSTTEPLRSHPLVADLFLFCYERDFMLSLSDNNQTVIIEAFNSTSRYLDTHLILIMILILNKW